LFYAALRIMAVSLGLSGISAGELEKMDLFTAGQGGYNRYHIPGLVVTGKGSILAWCEARKNAGSDWDDIDILMRRSTDDGLTWSEPAKIVSLDGPKTKNPFALQLKNTDPSTVTYNNPVMIADRDGTVHMLFCLEYMRCFYQRSHDDGLTWSEPTEITSAFAAFRQTYDWKVLATGPNHGIQLRTGRLIVPVWLSTGTGGNAHRPSVTATIYSDDGGKSWQAGEVAVPCTDEFINPNETVAIELNDGRVMLNVRNESQRHRRIVVTSRDGASGWDEPRFQDDLVEPICMAGLARYQHGDNDLLLFSHPDNLSRADGMEEPGKSRDRRNLTVHLSRDEGQTWTRGRAIEPEWAAYSDMHVTTRGTILCFYGRGSTASFSGDRLTLARFDLEWLTEAKPRKNVLFLTVDDLNTRLGCYGHDRSRSPNIDRLAELGVAFRHAYCQYPSCGPSRASVLTGLRPSSTGVLNNQDHFRKFFPDVVTLPQLFRRHGYFSARVGKIFHQAVPTDIGTSGLDDPRSWDQVINPRGRDKDEEGLLINTTPQLPLPDQMAYLSAAGDDREQTDGQIADATIELLTQHKDSSFFIAAGFYRPHIPYIAPRRYFELIDLATISLPRLPPDYRSTVPPAALASTSEWPNFGTTELQARECIQAYDACIAFVDAQIGRVLNHVEQAGLLDNTLIVLWGDHGYHLGEHGLWRKNSLYEESTRAPLIFAGAGIQSTGNACERIVEFVDIYPTVAELAGLPVASSLEGRSLVPLLENPTAAWPHAAFSETHFREVSGRAMRTERWRYVEWGEQGASGKELYDHRVDPVEMRNLSQDADYAKTVAELGRLIVEKRRE
jgi:sialidase-1